MVQALTENLPGGLASDGWILDCTLGGGGHTGLILNRLKEMGLQNTRVLGLDRDPQAIERARSRFAAEISENRLELRHQTMGSYVADRKIVGILADLGFSSDQVDDPTRGLSFRSDSPIDMRMDPSTGPSAWDLLQTLREDELLRILSEYGEERFSGRIASALVRARSEGRLPRSAVGVAEVIRFAVPPAARHGRIHAATRTFQALRIAVNQELEELDCFLRDVILFLQPGGRTTVLSFHSLEDRRVKQRFRQLSREPASSEGEWRDLTKKPIEPSETEMNFNPRARSAHLRILERTK